MGGDEIKIILISLLQNSAGQHSLHLTLILSHRFPTKNWNFIS